MQGDEEESVSGKTIRVWHERQALLLSTLPHFQNAFRVKALTLSNCCLRHPHVLSVYPDMSHAQRGATPLDAHVCPAPEAGRQAELKLYQSGTSGGSLSAVGGSSPVHGSSPIRVMLRVEWLQCPQRVVARLDGFSARPSLLVSSWTQQGAHAVRFHGRTKALRVCYRVCLFVELISKPLSPSPKEAWGRATFASPQAPAPFGARWTRALRPIL